MRTNEKSSLAHVPNAKNTSRIIGRLLEGCENTESTKLALKAFISKYYKLKEIEVVQDTATAERALGYCARVGRKLDMICLEVEKEETVDANKMTHLLEHLSPFGIVVLESNDTETLSYWSALFEEKELERTLAAPTFSIFSQTEGRYSPQSVRYQIDLFFRKSEYSKSRREKALVQNRVHEVAIVVFSSNHNKSIVDCLRTVTSQTGNFKLRILVIDNASQDGTPETLKSIISETDNKRITIEVDTLSEVVSVNTLWGKALNWAFGADFVALCDGADIWRSDTRIQEHIEALRKYPTASFSFDNSGSELSRSKKVSEIDHKEIVSTVLIESLRHAIYRGELADLLPARIFQQVSHKSASWLVGIYACQFGNAVCLEQDRSEVGISQNDLRSSIAASATKAKEVISLVDTALSLLNYGFREELESLKSLCLSYLSSSISYCDVESKVFDIIILDDTFPTPKNGFRYFEFTSLLQKFPKLMVLSTGDATNLVDRTNFDELISNFQRKYPSLGSRVAKFESTFPLHLGKVVYLMFLHNTYAMLPSIEAAGVRFVFTLYPGGGFALNDNVVDNKLRRVFKSSCFHKVIITQRSIYDYVCNKGLCPPDKIEMIPGGVMPDVPAVESLPPRRRWGYEKDRLDICFMAHKYSMRGEDKGYDLFVETAKALNKTYDDVFFHVAGGFDRQVIDVGELGDRIKFHGPLTMGEIDEFFAEMDLILSPNISGKLYAGSIDGFPTGCCVDAGMRGTAIFATDEFNGAQDLYSDGKDLVVVQYDVADIVEKVSRFYDNPDELRTIGQNAIETMREVHSFEAQVIPRVDLLQKAIDEPYPPGQMHCMQVELAKLRNELARRDVDQNVASTRSMKNVYLRRGLQNVLKGRARYTSRQLFKIFRLQGFKGLKRTLREIGSQVH